MISSKQVTHCDTQDERISDWALLRRRGGRRLVIAFSGVNSHAGSYAYYASFAMPGVDQLLLNCPDNGWYFKGVPVDGGVPALQSTVSFLQRVSAQYDETVVIGGSMGAYAALLYGSELPGAHVLAMSPEIYPGVRRGYFNNLARVPELPLCLSAVFVRQPDFRPWIVVGEKKATDLFCMSEVNSPRAISIRNGYHHVPTVLHQFFSGLGNILAPLVAGRLHEALRALSGQMLKWPELSNLLYLMELGKVPIERSMTWLQLLPADFYGRGYLALAIAAQFERRAETDKALDYAALAVHANPDDLEAHAVHDRLWTAIHGTPPEPRFESYINPAHQGVVNYQQRLTELRKLHGMEPILFTEKQGSVAQIG